MKKILFYCSGGLGTKSKFTPHMTNLPHRCFEWDKTASRNSELELVFYFKMPGSFLVDTLDGVISHYPEKVSYHIIPDDADTDDIVRMIVDEKPDAAIACTVPDIPYDWNPVKDSIVGERLRAEGIRTIAHPVSTSFDTFSKISCDDLLMRNGFTVARHVPVYAHLYNADNEEGVTNNIYKEYIFSEIKKIGFPIIIKPSSNSGSVGISVAADQNEAEDILSKSTQMRDVIVEELIRGDNFGAEIYGSSGTYEVTSPVIFTATDKGVTDPFSSVKFGPVTNPAYKVDELKKELIRLAEVLELSGWAEVDLIFNGEKWYIIEVNPRYSMLSLMPAAMRDEGILDPYISIVKDEMRSDYDERYALDIKSPVIPTGRMEQLKDKYDFLYYIMKFQLGGSETAEGGYCEYVVVGDDIFALRDNIDVLKANEEGIISDSLYDNIMTILKTEESV